ncbi:peptidoglycan-binding domain-containing protein [Streptomyces formicae]|uniref:Peptidoglycan-binding protein n=1 Tax=Streptomyces formicae TaxID=1616117 RepID=A0ABY3WQE3_9ACTN|nr:peptidoglycan-binding domain-containing protein [Streptomyces formicae]UNM14869.1 peptidoglycan-binding protein [Streptomyces formicae]
MTGRTCPECGRQTATEEGAAGASPACGCADFDPLRVRPYVPLLSPADGDGGPPAELLAEPAPAQEVAYEYEHEAAGHPDPAPERRRRPGALVVAVAVVAVLGSVAFAGTLLAGDEREGGEALPDIETMAPFLSAAPDAPSAGDPSSVSPSGSASASRSPSPSASASRSASPTASPSRSTSTSAAPPTTTVATGHVSTPATPPSAPTLGPGDSGPEVVELQERLDQVWLYDGPPNGQYDGRVENAVATYQSYRGITTDPRGTYGPATRRALEAETEYPSTGDDGDGDWDGDHGNGGGRGGRG